MHAALRPRYTFREYLEIEKRSGSLRHEYVAGDVFAMAAGSVEHAALAGAVVGLLFAHLRGGPCRVYGSDLGIWIEGADVATYADATVVCDPIERAPGTSSHVKNPRVIVEVLSPSTERYDREQKRLYYQSLPSLAEYVIVAQDRRRIEVWRREGGEWVRAVHDAGSRATLTSIGLELSVDELYAAASLEVR